MLRSAAINDLLSFSQILDTRYTVNWHHDVIARKLEEARAKIERGEKARIILEVPPRHGKSELATIKFPAQTLGLHPDWPIIVSSYSAELAEDFGVKDKGTSYKMTATTQFLILRFAQDTQARGRWLTEHELAAIQQQALAALSQGEDSKFGIIDDPFKNREEADSEVIHVRRSGIGTPARSIPVRKA